MSAQFFTNAHIVLDAENELNAASLLIRDGIVEAIGDVEAPSDAEVIDLKGCVILPGLFDAHVHLREPGDEDEETIESGSEAAIAGGFTGIMTMPNTKPPIDTGGMVTYMRSMAKHRSRIPFAVSGALTIGRKGEQLAEIADMIDKGAVLVTDAHHPVEDPYVLRRALEYTRDLGIRIAVFPNTPALAQDGVMHEGQESFDRGLQGIPAMAEEIAIERDLRIAEATKGHLHIQNVTTAGGVDSIRRAKSRGVDVTAEVTPHHLLLTDRAVRDYNTSTKMMPPLRTDADRLALIEGINDGTIDLIVTGHAPHTDFEKNMDFKHAPFGVIGLETALPAIYSGLVQTGQLAWTQLVKALSISPRTLIGFPSNSLSVGTAADLLIFDPKLKTLVVREKLKSRSFNSPWLGQSLQGKVVAVYASGEALLPYSS